LLKQVVQITKSQLPRNQTQAVDISHGRHLVKKVSVFDISDQKIQEFDKLKWGKTTSLIKVERRKNRGKKNYKHLVCYISSLSVRTEIFASKIRDH
jgi:hypothetical protein